MDSMVIKICPVRIQLHCPLFVIWFSLSPLEIFAERYYELIYSSPLSTPLLLPHTINGKEFPFK